MRKNLLLTSILILTACSVRSTNIFKFTKKKLSDKGFDKIENAKITLNYYIQTLDEIKDQTNQKDKLKICIHLPVLRFYLKNIDKISLDTVARSYSIRFCKQLRSKYFQLFERSTLFDYLKQTIFEADRLNNLFTKSIKIVRTKFNKFKEHSNLSKIRNKYNSHQLLDNFIDETEDELFDLS